MGVEVYAFDFVMQGAQSNSDDELVTSDLKDLEFKLLHDLSQLQVMKVECMCVCVCVCVCVYVRVCIVCVCVCERERALMRVHTLISLTQEASNVRRSFTLRDINVLKIVLCR